ncbi:PREDICTED: ovarian cancer-associated gene 2 protein homolog [Ceratosolen solmsi marchali]|uniref:Ovarian cancer-associated gene 2 protein homolog n=1 Tax=Ceratosolen solmsi marchali TaxID=326594 RepID=A0AAJ6YWJ8_9HYME|nr:PREDICTED: ovarian cancer-associated gene 2 protein homolog [Ceratosolen solmsi marchali]
MSSELKLKVLAIHGYRQSDKIFSAKIGSMRKNFKKELDFTFIRAPHKISYTEKYSNEQTEVNLKFEDTNEYGWWFNTQNKTFKAVNSSDLCVGFDESLQLIEQIFKEQGPFDGLIGFSQGGSFVSILCAMQQLKIIPIEFQFAIIISGFISLCKPHEVFYKQKINLPTLHVYGNSDQVIPTYKAKELCDLFIDKEVVLHEGGHYVPGSKHIYNNFIKKMITKKLNSLQWYEIL